MKDKKTLLIITSLISVVLLVACGMAVLGFTLSKDKKNNDTKVTPNPTAQNTPTPTKGTTTPTTNPTQANTIRNSLGQNTQYRYESKEKLTIEEQKKIMMDKLAEADGIALQEVLKLRDAFDFNVDSTTTPTPTSDTYTYPTYSFDLTPTPTSYDFTTPTPTSYNYTTPSPTKEYTYNTPTPTPTPEPTTAPTTVKAFDPEYQYYMKFVDPSNEKVKDVAKASSPEAIFKQALTWVWVSDDMLNKQEEKWLDVNTFLTQTPEMSTNPVKPKIASDCEEHAYTLVSALRASGVKPENVRVVIGQANFNNEVVGHAWVQYFDENDQKWFELEPSSASAVDPKTGEFVEGEGAPFDYFKKKEYPVVKELFYFNDQYYMNNNNGDTNAPSTW